MSMSKGVPCLPKSIQTYFWALNPSGDCSHHQDNIPLLGRRPCKVKQWNLCFDLLGVSKLVFFCAQFDSIWSNYSNLTRPGPPNGGLVREIPENFRGFLGGLAIFLYGQIQSHHISQSLQSESRQSDLTSFDGSFGIRLRSYWVERPCWVYRSGAGECT